jgi:hypothetical protein
MEVDDSSESGIPTRTRKKQPHKEALRVSDLPHPLTSPSTSITQKGHSMIKLVSILPKICVLSALCGVIALPARGTGPHVPEAASHQMVKTEEQALSIEGSWMMASAYEIRADGTRTTNYGEHPNGLLMVDKSGRYSLQIFRPTRPKFTAGDKSRGTAEEYREASMGSSTHTGHVLVDSAKGKLIFKIETASFPNWEGTQQVRDYTYKNGTLTYQVPAGASGNGTIAYSIWQRLTQ